MQLPTRRAQKLKIDPEADEPLYLTQDGLDRLRQKLERIEKIDLPQAIADVTETGQFGDFSENAEYQEAKGRMRRYHDQMTSIKERLKKIVVIDKAVVHESVQLGSIVVLETTDGKRKTFEIVGPQETDPLHGRLSFKSPLGAKLINRTVGDEVYVPTGATETIYKIIGIS
ncbi:GreA/GreB family elongation factor [Candidatus Uhrbacteria bacterium]|nr:GreA/GreB family elongation factor [Candidatus Uhrbacteria bacterium]